MSMLLGVAVSGQLKKHCVSLSRNWVLSSPSVPEPCHRVLLLIIRAMSYATPSPSLGVSELRKGGGFGVLCFSSGHHCQHRPWALEMVP